MTEDEKKTLSELEESLCKLVSDIYMFSSNVAYLASKADDLRAELHDLCYEMKSSYEWTE